MFKSKNPLKLLSVLLLTAVAFSLLQFSEVKAATSSYSEDFAATTYKDASVTNANWDIALRKTQLSSYNSSNKTALYPVAAGGNMVSISFVDASNGWSVSDIGAVINTTNGGSTWARQASIEGPNNIQMIDSSTGFISTGSGLYKTTDGGNTWTAQTLPSSGSVNSIYFLNSTTGWATNNSGQVIKTTDGSNWSSISTGSSSDLKGIYFVDAGVGYVVGKSGAILQSINGGTSWTALTSGTSEDLSSVYFTDASTGWVGGGGGLVLRTIDGGTTWGSADAGDFEVKHIKFADASKGWLVKDGSSGAWYSGDGGATWTEKAAPSDKVARGGLYVLNADTLWVGYEGGTIKYTSTGTGAASWTTQTTSTGFAGSVKDVSMTGASTGYAVTMFGNVLRTADGSTWSYVGTSNADNTNAIDCSSDSTCITVAKSGKIYKTTNSGVTWTQKGSGVTSNELRDVYMNADGTGTAVGDSGTILTTSDTGENWTSRTSGTTQTLRSVTYGDSATIYASGNNATVVKSTNSGTSWTSVNATGASTLSGICAFDANTAWAVQNDQYIYKTTNGGTSWTNQGGGGTPLGSLYACQAISSSIVWAVGENGLVWETTGGGSSWFQIGTWTNTTTMKFDLVGVDFPSGSTTGWFVGEGDTGLFKLVPTGGTQYQSSNTVQSSKINTGDGMIRYATLTASSTLNGETVTYYLSADGGAHWTTVTSGQEFGFWSNGGNDLRWKAVLGSSTGTNTPTLNSVSVSYTSSGMISPPVLTAGTVASTSVALSWAPAADADHFKTYEILYGTSAGVTSASPNKKWNNANTSNLATATTTSATVTGLTPSIKYYFKIQALDIYDNGPISEEISATTTASVSVEAPSGGNTGGNTGGGSSGDVTTGSEITGGATETVETNTGAQNAEEEAQFTEELTPVSVTATPVETLQLPKAETGRAQVNPNAAEVAIKALETAPETEATATAATQENLTQDQKNAEIVNVAMSGDLTSAETAIQITKAEKIINDVVQEAIKNAINSAPATSGGGGGGGIALTVNDGNTTRQITVKNINDIELKVELGRDKTDANYKKQLAKDKEDALGRGKELIVIDEATNLDDNDIADAYQIAHNMPLFNDDPDKDGYTTSEEIFLGLNPLKADAAPLKPIITNMNGKVVISGKDPISFRIAGKAGDKVKLALVPKKDREKILSLQQKSLFASILLSDIVTNINPSSRQVDLGSTTIDEHNQGELTVNKIIDNGEYYVIAEGKYGVGPAAKFTVDNSLDTTTPKLNIIEQKRGLPYAIQISLDLVEKIFKKFDKKNYILAYGGKDNLNARMYISGTADPGVTLYATWASRILSSVVLSDAKGNFEIDIPRKLAQGNHQVLVYAERGGKRTAISGVTKLALIKK